MITLSPLRHVPISQPELEIDLAIIAANYREMRRRYQGRILSAVVKNDGYGLGLPAIVARLAGEDCAHFWALNLDEALQAKAVAPAAEVFALHGLQGEAPVAFARHGVFPVLATLGEVEACAKAARRLERPLAVAIQFDTGLGRLGLTGTEVATLAERLDWLDALDIRSWVSHLSSFDLPDAPGNHDQRARLINWVARLKPAPISLASSSGVYRSPDWHFDIARVGSALYGVQTSTLWQDGLRPCYRLKAPLLRIAELPAGAYIGYRGSTRLERPSLIATAMIGYGNGLPQAFDRHATARIADRPVPIVGGVAMNLTMLDVTDLPRDIVAAAGSAIFLDAAQTVDDIARRLDCAPNAILTQIGAGTRRVYVNT